MFFGHNILFLSAHVRSCSLNFWKLFFLLSLFVTNESHAMKLKYKFSQAMQAYESENYQEAAKKFSRILKSNTHHTPSIIQLGLSFYKLRRFRASY